MLTSASVGVSRSATNKEHMSAAGASGKHPILIRNKKSKCFAKIGSSKKFVRLFLVFYCRKPIVFSLQNQLLSAILPPMFRVFLALFLLFSVFSPAFADLIVTSINESGGKYSVVFNKSIEISNIKLNQDSDNPIELPLYKDKRQFSLLNRDYSKKLAKSLKQRKLSDNAESKISFKINKFKTIQNHKSIRAFASVIFEDVLEVECRVMESAQGLWVAWPANKESSKWIKEFRFTDKNLKGKVEAALIERYKENERTKSK